MSPSEPALLKQDAFINGLWVPSERRFKVINPATQAQLAAVADCGRSEAEQAVTAAAQAFISWRQTPAKQRAALLRTWAQAMLQQQHALASLLRLEQGKTQAEAEAEIAYAASFLDWFAGEAERHAGTLMQPPQTTQRSQIRQLPVGVCSAITPWNFPAAMITRKLAPALAAGCTMVIKPAQQTPLTALALLQLGSEIGLPAGVVNVVTTSDAQTVGQVLTEHPAVAKFSFTGSTAVGKKLYAQCASTIKKVSLELGGNAPMIIFADANLDLAVEQLLLAKFRNAGQTCISVNRVLVDASIEAEVLARLQQRMQKLKVAAGDVEGVDYGPLISPAAVDKARHLIDQAVADGAVVHLDGRGEHPLGPCFMAPTLLSNVDSRMAISQQEIFAPVVAVQRFQDEAQALALANATEFGLAGYFCSEDYRRIERVAEQLQCGMLGINAGAISHCYHAFGGVKASGIGVEGSILGLQEYQVTKNITIGGFA